jgi:hypothetical protein
MKMRRFWLLSLGLITTVSLWGCGGSSTDGGAGGAGGLPAASPQCVAACQKDATQCPGNNSASMCQFACGMIAVFGCQTAADSYFACASTATLVCSLDGGSATAVGCESQSQGYSACMMGMFGGDGGLFGFDASM